MCVVCVGLETFSFAPPHDNVAAAGQVEVGAVGTHAARVPRGGDPGVIADDPATRVGDVDGEALDVRPDVLPLGLHDVVDAGDERRHRAERDHVGRAELLARLEVPVADHRMPFGEPGTERRDGIGAHTKTLSGRNAETIQFGASTISLILRSTATLQSTYASSRESPRSSTRCSIM